MKGIVAVKRVVDYAVRIRVLQNLSAVDISHTKMSMNPFCEIAVEEGVRMKNNGHLSELVAVSIGNEKCQDTLRHALAMGADRAILLKTNLRTDQELQPLAVSKLLKHIVQHKEHPMIVLLGKQAIDDDSGQVGAMLAAMLKWAQATCCSKIKFNEDKTKLEVAREVDQGLRTIEVKLPAVTTCDLRLNEPRYATLPNLMKAKKKPFEVIDVESLGLDLDLRLEVVRVDEPPKRSTGQMVSSVDELINKLKNEAKVIV